MRSGSNREVGRIDSGPKVLRWLNWRGKSDGVLGLERKMAGV